MNLSAVNRSVVLLSRLFDPGRTTQPFLPMTSGKPAFSPDTSAALPRTSSGAVGISPAHTAAFLRRLREDPHLRMHSVLLIRHGHIFCEADFGAQDHRVPRYTYSACKSIVSLAVGILCDQGKLHTEDKIVDLFSDRINAVSRLRLSALTVGHLLTMRSGIIFNELEAQTDEDWIKCYLNSGLSAEPGTQFQYNSLNTYMLSAIVTRVSGMTLSAFLQKHLFDAMDIRNYYWECCPRGIEKGGWGLYMRPEDLGKLGLLVLQNGQWGGRQLISADYISRAVTPQVRTPESTGRYDYGYQIWVGDHPRAFLFNGMFGQNVLAFPDTDVLIVSTAANDELFQQGAFYGIAESFFADAASLSDAPLPTDAASEVRLQTELLQCAGRTAAVRNPAAAVPPADRPQTGLFARMRGLLFGTAPERTAAVPATAEKDTLALPPSAALFVGKTFGLSTADAASGAAVGLLPAVMQTVQSNHTRGFVSVSFSRAVENGQEHLLVTYREHDDTHIFSAGYGHAVCTALTFHGVPFTAAAKVTFPTDEDGRPVCRLTVDFPEMPSSRILKLFLNRDGTAVLRQEETPGADLISRTVIGWKSNLSMQPVIGGALDKIDNDYLSYRIRRTLAPELILHHIQSEKPS